MLQITADDCIVSCSFEKEINPKNFQMLYKINLVLSPETMQDLYAIHGDGAAEEIDAAIINRIHNERRTIIGVL